MLFGALGALGRRFESCRPDQLETGFSPLSFLLPNFVEPKSEPKRCLKIREYTEQIGFLMLLSVYWLFLRGVIPASPSFSVND